MRIMTIIMLFVAFVLLSCKREHRIDHEENQISSDSLVPLKNGERLLEVELKDRPATEFLINEIFQGSYSDIIIYANKTEITSRFGSEYQEKLETIKPYYFEGGYVTKLRKWTYADFTLIFYMFEGGKELLDALIIEKPLDHLKKINIGDSQKEMIQVFGRDFYKYRKNLFGYWATVAEVQFEIERGIIKRIYVTFLNI